MERTPKETQQIQAEIIRIGQRFNLFKPERTLEDDFGFRSKINLATGSFMSRVTVIAERFEQRRSGPISRYFHPFNPEEGYQITQENFELQTTIEKHRKLDISGKRPFKKYLIPWFNSLRDDEAVNAHLYNEALGKKIFKPEILEELKRIRLQLFFPTNTHEGKPDGGMLGGGHITIWQFLPPGIDSLPFEELNIAVPEEKLYQMEGEFILVHEQRKEQGSEN